MQLQLHVNSFILIKIKIVYIAKHILCMNKRTCMSARINNGIKNDLLVIFLYEKKKDMKTFTQTDSF